MTVASTRAGETAATWALCVSTLDRVQVLKTCVECAVTQSRPPAEVVICDASADWTTNREIIAEVMKPHPGIRFEYITSEVRSLTWQRTAAIARCTADILFLIDDDAFLQPAAAAEVMRVYEADTGGRIASVSLSNTSDGAVAPASDAARKESGFTSNPKLHERVMSSRAGRFLWRQVLMMGANQVFVPYATGVRHLGIEDFQELDIPGIDFRAYQIGYCTTVRRAVALTEPHDRGLLAYCPAEDLDASYRYLKHGLNVVARTARIHHYEAQANRLKRFKVARLALTNVAYLVRKNSVRPASDATRYTVMLARRILAEFIKETGLGRLSYPQLRGALSAVVPSVRIMTMPRADLVDRYVEMQARTLGWTEIPDALRAPRTTFGGENP